MSGPRASGGQRPVALQVDGIVKSFGAVRALADASLVVHEGEIVALAGENGAGKSTLLKTLAGQHQPDSGQMKLFGKDYAPGSVAEARASEIGIVFQETMLQPRLTVAENLLGSDYSEVRRAGFISWRAIRSRAQRILREVGIDIDVSMPAEALELGEQRLVELAAVVARKPRLLLIDEITASLDAHEIKRFFQVVHAMRSTGVAVVYVSHHLEEIFELCDSVTVLRDGVVVGAGPISSYTHSSLTSTMVGREVAHRDVASTLRPADGPPVLSMRNLSDGSTFAGLDLDLCPGDIVGIAGLQGAGTESILETVFGLRQPSEGTMQINGVDFHPRGPRDAMRAGVALVPKERDLEGQIGAFSLARNVALPVHDTIRTGMFQSGAAERRFASEYLTAVGVRPNDPYLPCESLSGGNRQKVVIAKWLATKPKVLLLNNPTRGVDVGAKDEIYRLLAELAGEGMALLIASEELPELIGMCRRVIVLKRGQVTGFFDPTNPPTEDTLLERMI
jgi:rhamnose transport system ATP-binding protein